LLQHQSTIKNIVEEESNSDELNNSYDESLNVKTTDENKEKKQKRKQNIGVINNNANENVISFKRMTDIHTLNLKYFKDLPKPEDIKPEDANDKYKTIKNE